MESEVARFDFAALQGNLLPVKSFGLDDVAFIVKETDSIAAIANQRTISVPAHAFMLYNAKKPKASSIKTDVWHSN